MKVLFVCDSFRTSNPYVYTLVDGLKQQNIDVKMSSGDFWLNNTYDIIHFQWPEAIYDWSKKVTSEQIDLLRNRIIYLKQLGKKIVVTCHNLQPHIIKDKGVNALYQIIYEYSNLIIHMGRYSYQLLSVQYPNAYHVIIPHHIYDNVYHFTYNKKLCQKELGIDSSKLNILCFGEFRTDEEREFIIKLKAALKSDNIDFLVPGFYRKHWYAKTIPETYKRICKILSYKWKGLNFQSKLLDDASTEKYFTACDIVLIQRLHILNSGNLPMGFYAGRVVVGVNEGNVGCILRETGNPTFTTDDFDSAVNAIHQAIRLTQAGIGEKNRQLAEQEWNTNLIVKRIIKEYIKIIEQNNKQ